MNSILEKFKRKQAKQPAAPQPTSVLRTKHERTIPPHIVACKVCRGKGTKDGGSRTYTFTEYHKTAND